MSEGEACAQVRSSSCKLLQQSFDTISLKARLQSTQVIGSSLIATEVANINMFENHKGIKTSSCFLNV